MTGIFVSEEELHAYIDGELPAARVKVITRALALDPGEAARVAAFRRDRDRLAAAFAPLAAAPLPDAWLRRIEAAVAPQGDSDNVVTMRSRQPAQSTPMRTFLTRPARAWAIAACLALMLGAGYFAVPRGDTILAEAEAARHGTLPASAHFAGSALPSPETQRTLLSAATGLKINPPDLRRLGWSLVSLDTYRGAGALHYRNAQGQALSVYVRRSGGRPRFDILKLGTTRICVWQDEVVGAVMMGDMSAGQMMRVAGAAYADLDL
jgi:anti-sigma factor RsiW